VIAVIAVIARNRRDRKGKTLPLINADERGSGRLPKLPGLPKIAEIENQNQNL
jgi:hypothetical protein